LLVPEGIHLFPSMTVLENQEMGGFTRKGYNLKAEAEVKACMKYEL
jgi:ABC-type branched-subunit amino acid transport system ATPase component